MIILVPANLDDAGPGFLVLFLHWHFLLWYIQISYIFSSLETDIANNLHNKVDELEQILR